MEKESKILSMLGKKPNSELLTEAEGDLKRIKEKLGMKVYPEKIYDAGEMKRQFKALNKNPRKFKSLTKILPRNVSSIMNLGATISDPSKLIESVPLLNEAEPLGPDLNTLEGRFESGEQLTPEEIAELHNRYKL